MSIVFGLVRSCIGIVLRCIRTAIYETPFYDLQLLYSREILTSTLAPSGITTGLSLPKVLANPITFLKPYIRYGTVLVPVLIIPCCIGPHQVVTDVVVIPKRTRKQKTTATGSIHCPMTGSWTSALSCCREQVSDLAAQLKVGSSRTSQRRRTGSGCCRTRIQSGWPDGCRRWPGDSSQGPEGGQLASRIESQKEASQLTRLRMVSRPIFSRSR